jgi:RimJ/RimL family protein N-acetyltransferase
VIVVAAPVLDTPRLSLREPTDGDAERLFSFYSDPETRRYWNTPPMEHPDEARVLIERARHSAAEDRAYRWALVPRGGGPILGMCGLSSLSFPHRRAELGYMLGRAYWGQGYMREALEAVLAHGFERLDLHRIEAELDPRNTASERLLAGLGFVREGLLRERWRVEGEVSDSLYMGLLRPAWRATHGRR